MHDSKANKARAASPRAGQGQRPALYALTVCLVGLLILGLAGLAIWQARAGYRERAGLATQNLARLYAQRLGDRFDKLDLSLQLLSSAHAETLKAGTSPAALLPGLLRQHQRLHPELLSLQLADAGGQVQWSSRALALPAPQVAERQFFGSARDQAAAALWVDGPLRADDGKTWVIVLARRLNAADGSFAGVLYANVATSSLGPVLASAELGPAGAATLRNAELALVHRHPDTHGAVGSKEVSAQLREAVHRAPAAGVYLASTAIDGIERSNAYQRLEHYPFYVLVGLATSADQAAWRTEALTLAGLALLALLVTALSAGLLYRRTALLAAREAELRKVQHLAGMGNWTWDCQSGEHYWSPQIYRLYGRAPQAGPAVYPEVQRYFSPHSWTALAACVERCLQDGKPYQCDAELQREDGARRWVHICGEAARDARGRVRRLHGTVQDITALKQTHAEMEHYAYHDALTGLPNRLLLMDRLPQALALAERQGRLLALCYLDLDGFKPVNDRHGHAAGDQVLRVVAQRLAQCMRGNDTVARLGGDEFVILMNQLEQVGEAVAALQRVIALLRQPIELHGQPSVRISACAGVAIFPDDAGLPDVLLGQADLALYEGKRRGPGSVCLYSELVAMAIQT
ncbi:diguanylate cyclase [Paucibacter sediminis]|uniref:Diguanylate cyclase n=1 Tax=Paucibacter sediminis TaxID=3019553 RepID=A0AA95NAC6_9BURK|nr:diguanylate cyclase [Paucibacter sp. S2-9]WIT10390.1 diguanylate cyclase [Paucibacter sp. S2-9]